LTHYRLRKFKKKAYKPCSNKLRNKQTEIKCFKQYPCQWWKTNLTGQTSALKHSKLINISKLIKRHNIINESLCLNGRTRDFRLVVRDVEQF
jgi:hypothetical protein